MRYVLLCPDYLLEHLAAGTTFPGDAPVYLVSRRTLRARLARAGASVTAGDPADSDAYRKAAKHHRGAVIAATHPSRLGRAVAAAREAFPDGPVLVVTDDGRAVPGATTVPLGALGESVIRPALDRACSRARVERIRGHFAAAERGALLMKDDPGPDAIASAFALKTLLGRTRASAPLCTFGTITRPENVAMCRILDIDVEEIEAQAVAEFDRVAMVDVQPSFLEEHFDHIDLVIDHHPVEQPVRAS